MNDYFTGDGDQTATGGAPNTRLGFGPNTRTILKITVGSGSGDSVSTNNWLTDINAKLRTNFLSGNQPGLLFSNGDPSTPAFPFTGVAVPTLTCNRELSPKG